jgi:hypothetical protein
VVVENRGIRGIFDYSKSTDQGQGSEANKVNLLASKMTNENLRTDVTYLLA